MLEILWISFLSLSLAFYVYGERLSKVRAQALTKNENSNNKIIIKTVAKCERTHFNAKEYGMGNVAARNTHTHTSIEYNGK